MQERRSTWPTSMSVRSLARSSSRPTDRIMAALTGLLEEVRARRHRRPVSTPRGRHTHQGQPRRSNDDYGSRLRGPAVGARPRHGARWRRHHGADVGRRRRWSTRSLRLQPGVPARASPLPGLITRGRGPVEGRGRRRHRRPRGPEPDPARQSGGMGIGAAHRRGHRVPHEGGGTRHDQTDERGHRGVGEVDPSRIVVVSGPNLAKEIAVKQPAASGCLPRRGGRRACCGRLRPLTSVLHRGPTSWGPDRRCRERRSLLSPSAWLRTGLRGQLRSANHHQAHQRTMRLGMCHRRGGADLRRPRRSQRPHRDVHVSALSRNHSFGVKGGQGLSVDEVVAQTSQTAEGVKSCTSILDLAEERRRRCRSSNRSPRHDRRAAPPKDVVRALLSRSAQGPRSL